jgi:hypothetical protein
MRQETSCDPFQYIRIKNQKQTETARLAIRPINYDANSKANALATELAYLIYVTPVLKICFVSSDGSIRLIWHFTTHLP